MYVEGWFVFCNKETFPDKKFFRGRTRGENGEVLQRGSMTTTVEVIKDTRHYGLLLFRPDCREIP